MEVCPMQTERYFMSSEAEKAAILDMLTEYQEVSTSIGVLINEVRKWGAELQQFGGALERDPAGTFRIDDAGQQVYVTGEGSRLPNAFKGSIHERYMDFERLKVLLRELQTKQKRKIELHKSLEPTGFINKSPFV